MKNEFFKDTRLLDAIDHIDSDLIAETAAKIRPPVSPKREAEQPKKTKFFTAWKQAAALVACTVLMGALIPVISMIVGNIAPIGSNFGAGNSPSSDENPETEPPVTDEETNVLTVIYDGSEGLEYQMHPDGKTAMFIGFGTCTDENVVIASTYNGVPVTEMHNDRYYSGVPAYQNGSVYAKSIKVSETVESIYSGVFEVCPNLKSVYIGENVKYLRPFNPNNKNDRNLEEIIVHPDNRYFFVKGNCLIETQSKTLIVSYQEAVIPDDGSVRTIGALAFSFYPYKNIVIPESIRNIDSMAFVASSLESVVLPKSLKKLADNAFVDCKELKRVDFNGYTEVPFGMFHNARSLTEVVGLENITAIGNYAFTGCDSLEEITLGAGLTEIGQQAFYANFNLKTINFAGTVEQWNAIKKGVGWNTLMNDPDWHEKIPVEFINCSDGVAKP